MTTAEARRRVDNALRQAQQQQQEQQPGVPLDMATFVSQGGFDQVITQAISSQALENWGRKIGLTASERLVDGEIAGNPAFFGPTGKFARSALEAGLGQARIRRRTTRTDLAGGSTRRQTSLPVA